MPFGEPGQRTGFTHLPVFLQQPQRVLHPANRLIETEAQRDISFARILKGAGQTFRYPGVLIRGSLGGAIIGGTSFIRKQTDVVYSIILGNLGQVILLAVIGLLSLRLLGLVVRAPLPYLVPSVLAMCA